MAITYGFFNSANGDRVYNAEDLGRYLRGIVSSGVYADNSTSLQVYAESGMTISVQPGRAMLDCHFMENDEPYTLTLSNGDTLDRIDAIIMRLDMNNRLCEIAVKEGTPATTPTAPAMSRTDVKKEYMLASVYVTKYSTSVAQSKITDTRGDNTVCGWVHGVIDQIDTTTLMAQMQADYEAQAQALKDYIATQQAEFDTWFNALTSELNVLTYIQEYKNIVTLESTTQKVYIGISDFVAGEDVLDVNYRGLIYMEEDYTLYGTGADAYVMLKEARNAGDPIEFRVLKSKIGSATAAATFALDDDNGNVLTDEGSALTL